MAATEKEGPARSSLRERIRGLKREVRALGFALADPRTPRLAKILAAVVLAYALSPIDLIPDPIPVLGWLDDLLLLPLGIWLVRRSIPPEVLADARRRAETEPPRHPRLRLAGAIFVILVWLVVAYLLLRLVL